MNERTKAEIIKSLEQEIWAPVPDMDPNDRREYGKALELRNETLQIAIEIVEGKRL